ncbi:MAG TPA: FixH family protein [Thermodesulfobacteriota bacterium]|nr:FixH family protein [Deltaproteobacteria bacterium]HNR13482.1 FixH family protein [Thermodesulfobacteriota bacterium]HNU70226.1 FixH family protein [Thermodesulfobacteriota bacterium]HOC38299.1 FixH family protein [Thermodesulfobacteriota bacterium]HQO76896.1 FixH family protein [Thermodesulfobacteriota bacterium]
MNKFVLVLSMLALIAGVGCSKGFEATKQTGQYTVVVTMDKNPPIIGDNRVEIQVSDKSGKPVKDATVKVEYGMPAMPGMPAMDYSADAAFQEDTNRYIATINPSMAGSWYITVLITRAEKTEKAKFNVDVK